MPGKRPQQTGPSRRSVMRSSAGAALALALPGCGVTTSFFQPKAPTAAIDIHNHIFNGRDVPVAGFLQQVILRDGHAEVDANIGVNALLQLLKDIMLFGTPTAQQELVRLHGSGAAPLAPVAREARDQQAVEQGLVALARESGVARTFRSAAPREEETLISAISADLGQPDRPPANARIAAAPSPEQRGQTLAVEIFRQEGPGEARSYVHNTPLIAKLRWAGMMTRARADILAELVTLYGGPNGIRVYSPSLVDMGAWFRVEEPATSVADQVEVFSALAQFRRDILLLPFVPFCPLRAALEREDQPGIDVLRHVKLAVMERGFAGVKLYPPMGFRPLGNSGPLGWVRRAPRRGAAALDDELLALYTWCAANEVPIKAHANNSIAAGPGTGNYAHPALWRAVLDRPGLHDLHLNLAHFGGFEETRPNARNPGQDWEDTIAVMIGDYPNLYFDLAYWSEVSGTQDAARAQVIAKMRALLTARPQMHDRIMYGSDWSMLGQEPGHPAYFARVEATLREDLGFDPAQITAAMGGNAARYLGLDRNGPQRQRLDAAFRTHPTYQQLFG